MNATNQNIAIRVPHKEAGPEREKPSWIVDLCSFYVQADSEEEAFKEAWKMIEAGEAEIDIDQVVPSAFD